jgi:hypothetical protein
MMGTVSFGLGLLCAAMMALMCLPMAVGMIRGWRRRPRTGAPPTTTTTTTPPTTATMPVASHAGGPVRPQTDR